MTRQRSETSAPAASGANSSAAKLFRGRPWRSSWRWPAALAVLVAGVVHIPVTPEHLHEAPYIGVLFIVLTAACAILALGLISWDSTAVWLMSAETCLFAVLGYAVSRSVALPQIGADVGNWFEPLGVAAVLAELAVVVLAVVATTTHRGRRSTGTLTTDLL